MFLQIYFFVVTIYGWYKWNLKDGNSKIKISKTEFKNRIFISVSIIIGTLIAGFLFTNIHMYFPTYFKIEAAYPFTDSLVMVMSIAATILLAKKKVETWYLWILIDLICIVLYFKKEVYFLSMEYLIFLGLACLGLHQWKKELCND